MAQLIGLIGGAAGKIGGEGGGLKTDASNAASSSNKMGQLSNWASTIAQVGKNVSQPAQTGPQIVPTQGATGQFNADYLQRLRALIQQQQGGF